MFRASRLKNHSCCCASILTPRSPADALIGISTYFKDRGGYNICSEPHGLKIIVPILCGLFNSPITSGRADRENTKLFFIIIL